MIDDEVCRPFAAVLLKQIAINGNKECCAGTRAKKRKQPGTTLYTSNFIVYGAILDVAA
jgi:hypothetical protein